MILYRSLFESAGTVTNDDIVDFRIPVELLSKFFFGLFDKGAIQLFFNKVDGTTAEAAAHDTRTRNAAVESQVVQEIKFFATYTSNTRWISSITYSARL